MNGKQSTNVESSEAQPGCAPSAGSASVMGNPMTESDMGIPISQKLEKCIAALDGIACDYEWMKRKDMIERAARTLCEIGEWRKVMPGEFARHGHVFSSDAGNPVSQSAWLRNVLDDAKAAKNQWPLWAKGD